MSQKLEWSPSSIYCDATELGIFAVGADKRTAPTAENGTNKGDTLGLKEPSCRFFQLQASGWPKGWAYQELHISRPTAALNGCTEPAVLNG
jgi:hypothetical protein